MRSTGIFTRILLFLCLIGGRSAFAASATNDGLVNIIAAIGIVNVSALDFGTGVGGDIAKTVLPGTLENATNGSFTVTGQASTAYSIILPSNGTVNMITAGGGTNKTIAVSNFTSFPSGTGTLGAGGSQLLLIGATRAALSVSQIGGSYSGAYTVTVIY